MSRCCVMGAGGFIGGWLTRYFLDKGYKVRAVDKKPLPEWYQRNASAENLRLDLLIPEHCRRACEGVDEVYQLAASMGGMGWIEKQRIDCMRNSMINEGMLSAAYDAGVDRYWYASSACAYNTELQNSLSVTGLCEEDAYPAQAERGYGWEKLYSEMLAQEYTAERGMKTFIARMFNVYGPYGTWDGDRAKAPAAICRKVIEAKHTGSNSIEVWGDGEQLRNYMWIEDCVLGIDKIAHFDGLIASPINLGSEELVSVNELVSLAEEFAGVKVERRYNLNAPKGVRGRNSDNTRIRNLLKWEPTTAFRDGLRQTYAWIEQQYLARQRGERVIQ